MSNVTCLNLAIKTAERSICDHRHGALILKNGKPLSFGFNKYSVSSFALREGYYTTHAEIDALSKLKHRELSGVDILIIRINKRGELMLSKPCEQCMKILVEQYNIRKVFFSNDKGSITMMRI